MAVDSLMELFGQAHLVLLLVEILDEAHEGDLAELGPVHGHVRAPTSRALSVASVGAMAMPMLAPMVALTECR